MYWRNWWCVKCSVFCRNITQCAHCATCRVKCLDVSVCIYMFVTSDTAWTCDSHTVTGYTQLSMHKGEWWIPEDCAPLLHSLTTMHVYKGMCSVELYGYPVHICIAEFGHVVLCMYVCVCTTCICGQKDCLFEVLPLEILPLVKPTAHSSSLTTKKDAYNARQFILGKKFGTILLMRWEKARSSKILYYGMPHLV